MHRRAPVRDIDEADLTVGPPQEHAAGIKAVTVALQRGVSQAGVARTARSLARLNQAHGFDCPGCAWPEPQGRRRPAEFCENGAKAVAEEATLRTVGPEFFAAHPVSELLMRTEHWLGSQGRLTEPMMLEPGSDHYRPISWDEAFGLVATALRATTADRSVFYTSGRTSNEAAFLYQLFVRCLGTNNLPDCSNMCHESSGSALSQTIGIGKGSVSLEDIHEADLVLVMGQNPGTNHPRMLTALTHTKQRGGRVVAVNPLPEAGLLNFRDPQTVSGLLRGGTDLADDFLQIRLGGDLALLQAVGHLLVTRHADTLDRDFIAAHTRGFEAYAAARATIDWAEIEAATGLPRTRIEALAEQMASSQRTIICWAMGLTQHKHSVPTLRELVDVLLLRGMIGKPGAGVCPVRGHSNVQGDRTMGIYEKPPASFLDALEREFALPEAGVSLPREHGYDVVEALQAMGRGEVDVFVAMGGNFIGATPDTTATEAAMRSVGLTVQISTKLNRSHLVHGTVGLILPTLGRSDADTDHPGGAQFVSVEDSMSAVHASRGRLTPVSEQLLAEPVIVARLAQAVLGDDHPVDWAEMAADYDVIRDHIAGVLPDFADYNTRVRHRGGFVLPHPPRDSRTFSTASGRAEFTVNELTWLRVPPGRLLLQTLRSHDQYNTTIYGLDDRYRGIANARRVVLVNPDDLAELGLAERESVDVVSEWTAADGTVTERRGEQFTVVGYPTPRGCAAAYYPEANVLIPTDSVADESNTPTSKSVVIRLESRSPHPAKL
ncbi:FdhF/YdeP family oxidoreductase [Nakamurella leprariae]|uniref:FdhF/YdeP family oxidoreductase n=1 Tax=Nakamurella leprariae TaxID=2803911 RepID=A0A938YGB5_9ACTN|nr:FdhF/YdeP family oxidoreductase [Nakamurella leprariae]MBM9467609.1 FdhF/YdeP family oxidoreductase [Nakamurella leprariae]